MEDIRIALDFDSKLYSKITPAFRYNGKESMESWQKRAYDRLWALLGLDKMVKPKDDMFKTGPEFEMYGVKVIPFSFQNEEGYFVPRYIALPKDWNGQKLPLYICLQGHSSGMHNSLYMNYDRTPMTQESEDEIDDGDKPILRPTFGPYVEKTPKSSSFIHIYGNDHEAEIEDKTVICKIEY